MKRKQKKRSEREEKKKIRRSDLRRQNIDNVRKDKKFDEISCC